MDRSPVLAPVVAVAADPVRSGVDVVGVGVGAGFAHNPLHAVDHAGNTDALNAEHPTAGHRVSSILDFVLGNSGTSDAADAMVTVDLAGADRVTVDDGTDLNANVNNNGNENENGNELDGLDANGNPDAAPPPAADATVAKPAPGKIQPLKKRPFNLRKSLRKRKWSIIYFVVMAIVLTLLGVFVWTSFTWKSWIVVVTLTIMVWAMVSNFPPDIVLLTGIAVFTIARVVPAADAFSGFSNGSVIAIAFLLIPCAAVEATGVLDSLLRALFRCSRSIRVTLCIVLIPVCLISVVVPTSPLVAMLIPVIDKYSTQFGFASTKLLMPLSFAAIIGGQGSLIGSFVNLFVTGILNEENSPVQIGFFEIGVIGFPTMAVCFLYMPFFLFLLPAGHKGSTSNAVRYCAYVRCYSPCGLIGRTVKQAYQVLLPRLELTGIRRTDGDVVINPPEDTVIFENDILLLAGAMNQIKELYRIRGIRSAFVGQAEEEISMASHEGEPAYAPASTPANPTHLGPNPLVPGGGSSGMRATSIELRPVTSADYMNTSLFVDDQDMAEFENPANEKRGRHLHIPSFDIGGRHHRRQNTYDKAGLLTSESDAQRQAGLRRRRPEDDPLSHALELEDKENKRRRFLVEAVLSRESPLCGRTPDEVAFKDRFNAVILAIRRSGGLIPVDEPITFVGGDLLLLSAVKGFVGLYNGSSEFAVVSSIEKADIFDLSLYKKFMSIGVLTAIVLLTAFNLAPLSSLSLAGALILLLTRTVSQERARRATRAPFLITLSAAFGIATALDKSGVGREWGNNLISLLSGWGDVGVLIGIVVVTSFLSFCVSNAAAVAIVMPIAHGVLENPLYSHLAKAVYMCVMMGGAICFASPLGYPTNLMVMGPGGYTFGDFVKYGGPLQLICSVVTVFFAYFFFVEHKA